MTMIYNHVFSVLQIPLQIQKPFLVDLIGVLMNSLLSSHLNCVNKR